MEIIQKYSDNAIFMEHFLRMNGPFLMIQKLKTEHNKELITEIMNFIHAAIVRFKIAGIFFKAGLLS